MANNLNLWWGYVHQSGTIHVKRYFDERDIEEANESPFCALVTQAPYQAIDRDDAIEKLKQILNL